MRSQHQAVIAWLCAGAAAVTSITHARSTVSVYLPKYDDSDWAALRGSILSSVRAEPNQINCVGM